MTLKHGSPDMATRRRAAKQIPDDDIELATFPGVDELPTQSATEERRERELEEILGELGSDARVRVWQIVDGRSAYAGDMSVEGFNLDLLLETYGGGDKSLVIYQGKRKIETVRVSLDPSIPPRNPRTPRVAAQAQAQSGGMGDMMPVFAQMMAMQAQGTQMMSQVMAGVVSAMTAMATVRPPERDPMDVAVKMAELMKRDGGGGAGASELIGMLKEGISLGGKMGGKDGDDGVMSVVGEGMKTLGVLVDGIVTQKKAEAAALASRPVSVVPAPAHTHTNPLPIAAQNGTTEDDGMPMVKVRPWVDAARPHMGMLLQAARFMPPTAAADTVASNLDDDSFFDLIADIHDQTEPGFGGRLVQYFPAAADIKAEWIGELVTVLLSEHVEPDEEEGASPASDGAGAPTTE